MSAGPLARKRVLVVEDEVLICMLIEDMLADEQSLVVGPFSTLADALKAAGSEAIDIAVLDVNLRGEKVYPVAEVLAQRSIPFVLLSGYGNGAIPPDRPQWRAVAKPFAAEDLARVLIEVIQPRGKD